MALTLQNRIINQVVDDSPKYFYLYEPLPVMIEESNSEAKEIKIDLVLVNSSGTTESTLSEYGVYDINTGNPLNLDLMELIKQAHNADVWKISNINDIVLNQSLTADKYTYELKIYSDSGENDSINLSIIPLLGGRKFRDFSPLVSNNFPINDFEKYEVDISTKWKDYPTLSTVVNLPNSTNKITVSQTINSEGICPCGGMLYWKSRLSGWMQWGFDIKKETSKSQYSGNIEVGLFTVKRNEVGVNPFVETNYSNVNFSNTVSLKSLSLNNDELNAVNSINETPICYYMSEPNGVLELMKISSTQVPLDNLSNGGDFQVTLKNISQTNFKTR